MSQKRKKFIISFFILIAILISLVIFYTSAMIKEKRIQAEIENFIKIKFNGCVVYYEDNRLKTVNGIPHSTIKKEDFAWILNLYVCSEATSTAFKGDNVLIIFR